MNFQRKSFSETVPNLQIAWDSTSLGLLKECPYKYFLKIVLGYSAKKESQHLTFGTAYHSVLEFYDNLRAKKVPYEEALRKTIRKAMEITGSFEMVSVPESDPETNILTFIPWSTDMKEKSRFALVRAVVWYIEQFKDEAVNTVIRADGSAAVEVSFRFETPLRTANGETYIVCGHLDKLVEINGAVWIVDRKTTKGQINSHYFDGYSPNNQMSLYSTAGALIFEKPVAGVVVDAVQVGVHFARFARGFAPRTPGLLQEWIEDAFRWIQTAESYALSNLWPMNDTACGNYGGCQFRGICSKDPSVRKAFLDSDFVVNPWDPLQVRN